MPKYSCSDLFTEEELRRAHSLVMPAPEAEELARDLTTPRAEPTLGVAWSQGSLVLLSLLGAETAAKVRWARENCGIIGSGKPWAEEEADIRAALGLDEREDDDGR